MKTKQVTTTLLLSLMLLALAVIVPRVYSQGSGTTAFTYQGELQNSGSAANGNFDFEFKLYDALSGGNLIAGPITRTATVSEGIFSVNLDFGVGIFDGQARYLELGVRASGAGAFTTLSPRQEVTAAPYAIYASNVEWNGIANGPAGVWQTFTADSGSTSADSVTDTLTIVGSGPITTAISGDTLLIGGSTGAADNLGNHTASQNLNLSSFKLVGNGGSVGLSISSDGDISIGNSITIDGVNDTITASGGTIDFDDENIVTTGSMGIGISSPGQRLHLTDGNLLIQGSGQTALIVKRDVEFTGGPSGTSTNPIFQLGRIEQAGDGDPEFRFLYSDDAITETSVLEFDRKGIVASVKPDVGSHFEGFIAGDSEPLFRLNSSPKMQLEMGPGGSTATDVAIRREVTDTLTFLTGGTERVRIEATGNVGIGMITPTEKLDVSGNIHASGTIASGNSIVINGTTDTITAGGGTIDFDNENLTTTGTITANALTIAGLDCTGNSNGGALTADASGTVSCSDDDGAIMADSLDFTEFTDTLTVDITTTIEMDSNAADLNFDSNTFVIDSSANRVGLGTAAPQEQLHLSGGNLLQTPGNPVLVGSLSLGSVPGFVYVSGRYAYVTDVGSNDLKVIDVSNPSMPSVVGSLGLGDFPQSVYVSGRYAYVVDTDPDDLKVIDVSDPSSPSLVGSLSVGTFPLTVVVSGRYAYVTDKNSTDLKVIDVSDPSAPSLTGSLGIGGFPLSVYVSGRYAYVVDDGSDDLKVIDVSDPSSPSLIGSLGIGTGPLSIYVSGRYAYIVEQSPGLLRIIDVSNPSTPSFAGSLGIGAVPRSVFVSGRYAYVVDSLSDDLKVIDVSNPSVPSLAGSLDIGGFPRSMYVSGRYAYVVDTNSSDLKVIDVSGTEVTSLMAHSLEAGNLQVRNDIVAQGQLQVTSGVNIGAGGLFSDGNVGLAGTLALANDITPTASLSDSVQLYAEDVAASSELKVRDEAGNITTLSPHNFSLIGEPSEPLAWSYYSENDQGKINVDMLRAIRLLEEMSGEKLVHLDLAEGFKVEEQQEAVKSLRQHIAELEAENEALKALVCLDHPGAELCR